MSPSLCVLVPRGLTPVFVFSCVHLPISVSGTEMETGRKGYLLGAKFYSPSGMDYTRGLLGY